MSCSDSEEDEEKFNYSKLDVIAMMHRKIAVGTIVRGIAVDALNAGP
jgi:hypothetical protein